MIRRLNDVMVRQAKPNENGKAKKYTDGGQMYLIVSKTGKYWRYNYKFMGKSKTLALGIYPSVGLKEARERHDKARELLGRGIDPSRYKKMIGGGIGCSESNSFELIALEWFSIWKESNSKSHVKRTLARLKNDVFPFLGGCSVESIEPPDVLIVLRRIEARGALETAHRVKQLVGLVFKYAVATGRAKRDQTADLKGALKPYRKKHFPAIVDPVEFGHLLRVIDHYRGSLVVRCAFKLSPLVMLRPSELAGAEWSEVDFDSATWTIPVKRMKEKKYIKEENTTSHIVPLSKQAIVILREVHLLTGRFVHVFTGARDRRKPMNSSSINVALKRLGYGSLMKAHSFRTTASTLLNQMKYSPDAIERQLAHKDKNKVRGIYNRAEYVDERREMLQFWADYLDDLKKSVNTLS
jgi:integrase